MKLNSVKIIAHKELEGYLNSPLGYLFLIVFLLVSSLLFFREFFLIGQSTLRSFFESLPWILLFLIPAITMRLWAEEKKMGTFELLLTSPVTPLEAVLGKFWASFELLFLALFLSGILPLILFFIGQPDWGAILGGYLGALFLGASYLAIGLFISSLTDNQIIAFILSVLIVLALLVTGNDLFLNTMPQALVPFLKYISLHQHFESLGRGVIDSRNIVYYSSLLFLFLYLNVFALHQRKWK